MEIKHKECFTPMFIKHFQLQANYTRAKSIDNLFPTTNLLSVTRLLPAP